MKKSIRIITVAMSLLIAFSVSVSPVATRAKGGSAKQEAAKSKKPKYKIKVKKSMVVGEKQKLKVTKLKKGDKVKWSSSKKKVATVSKKGLVKAVKAGTAKITAKIGKKKRSITLTVKPKPEKKEIITPTPTPFAGISPTPWPKRTPYNGPTPTPTPGPTPPVTIDQIPYEIEIKTDSVTGYIYFECNFENTSEYALQYFRIDLLVDEGKPSPTRRTMETGLHSGFKYVPRSGKIKCGTLTKSLNEGDYKIAEVSYIVGEEDGGRTSVEYDCNTNTYKVDENSNRAIHS